MNYYIYIYWDPRFDRMIPIYVGKGNNDRAYQHLVKCDNFLLKNKLDEIRKFLQINNYTLQSDGTITELFTDDITHTITNTSIITSGTVLVERIAAISEEHAFDMEMCLIREFGRIDLESGTLCNMTDGGPWNKWINWYYKDGRPTFFPFTKSIKNLTPLKENYLCPRKLG